MMIIDPFVHVLPGLPDSPPDVAASLRLVEEMCRHDVTCCIDLTSSPMGGTAIPEMLVRKRQAAHTFRAASRNRFRRFRYLSSVIVPLHSAAGLRDYLPDLWLTHQRFLPISLPFGHFLAQEEAAYSGLFSLGVSPLLVWERDKALFWNDNDIKRITSLPKTVYLFPYSAFQDAGMLPLLWRLMDADANIIVGSGVPYTGNTLPSYQPLGSPIPEMKLLCAYFRRTSAAFLSHGFF